MTIFHILDAFAQDVEDGAETAETRQIIPRGGELTDDEEEAAVPAYKRRKAGDNGGAVDNTRLHMNIYLFGATVDGTPVRACVEGFQPFFFVRLPDKKAKTRLDFERLLDDTIRRKRAWLGKVLQRSYEDRKVLYGYTGDQKFRFARLTVPSIAAFRALRRLFLDGDTSRPIFQLYAGGDALEVFEANLDPMLRFFHLRDIKPAGWVETDAELEEDGQLATDWDEIRPCLEPPAATAPFLLAAWDIECYSENGEFPLAKKGYDRMAKQLWAAAGDGAAAADLILEAAAAGAVSGSGQAAAPAPKGMDLLRHREPAKLSMERLRQAVRSEVFQQGIGPLLEKKDGVVGAVKEERISKIRGVLGGTLRTVLPLAGDPVIQIGVVLVRGAAAPEKHIFVLDTCEPVPGATVHAYSTEKAMILGWAAAMRAWNPDILVGYNVFGFDEKYLWERLVELKIQEDEDFQALSRLGDMNKRLTLEEKFLSSSALGDNTMWMWSTFGRLQVDLFHYIKRSFSLPAYKLDYVCQHFMSGKLGGVDVGEAGATTWFLKTKSTGDAVVGRYVVLLDETGDVAVDKLRICAIEAGKGLRVEAPGGDDEEDLRAASADAVKWAVVKDDVSPADIFNLHVGGGASGRSKVAAYCVQDCDLVVELYKKLDVFNNAMAMANACSVPISYIFTRGQGIKIESLIFKECYQRGQCVVVLPTQPRRADGEAPQQQEDSYEGAIVLTPTPGFYFKSPIGVADFASLYPSTIISENISHDTLIWAKDYDMSGNFMGYAYGDDGAVPADGPAVAWTDIEFDIWGVKEGDTRKQPEKVKRGLRVCRYAQFAGDAKGTLPEIVQGLLAARKAKRKEAEKETDPFKKALLDAEQLAYKLTANSLYGQLGSATFKIRLQHLAASVTAYGRKQIMFAKAAIERFYGPDAGRADCHASAQTVYGDSVGADTILESLRLNGVQLPPLKVEQLGDLFGNAWIPCVEHGRQEKESCETPGLETLTEKGWTHVERVIRHHLATAKKMLRVYYHTHETTVWIDVTEDHSMVLASGQTISPKDLKVGDKLLHHSGMRLGVDGTEYIDYKGYVYDLTTENHHFQAGQGGLVVHNTDSLFVTFNVKNPETGELLTGREAIVATMKLTEEAGKMVTSCLKAPHDFEYEKVFTPFIIFSKKRYVGNKYEESPDEYTQNSMGIATKRRDYAGIVKVIYGGAIRILLTQKDPVAAAAFVKEKLTDLAAGRVSTTQLTMSKSLRSEYKAVTPPAHKILAERIAARDPGNAPASGDRISFLYVLPPVGQAASKNQGERIETPAWIKQHGLEIDVKFYMEHQLMNPISQLFALIAHELPGCVAPGGRSWANATDADREYAATEYLFRDALNMCDKAAARRFGAKMFGSTAAAPKPKLLPLEGGGEGAKKRVATLAAPAAAPPALKIQTNLSSFFVQNILLKELGKKSGKRGSSPGSVGSSESQPATPVASPPAAPAASKKGRPAKGKVLEI
jgi:DNA polymerase elongation subunit (family B)